jgi:hypothetical protein
MSEIEMREHSSYSSSLKTSGTMSGTATSPSCESLRLPKLG